jgi:PII-like signaling protein
MRGSLPGGSISRNFNQISNLRKQAAMKIEGEAHLLRILVGESDRWEGRPLYEAIVRAARDQGLAGATALRGIEGYGASNRIHTVKILRLSEDLPIVIEIVDRPERIAAFLGIVDEMISEGLVTIEKVHTIMYRHDSAPAPPEEEDEIQLDTSDFAPPTAAPQDALQLTDRATEVLAEAKKAAADSRRVFADSVDVLLAMLCESKGIAGKALSELGIDCGVLERSLREEVSRDEHANEYLAELESKSLDNAKWLEHDRIGTEHLLLALCQIRPSAASDILMRLGAPPREICKQVLDTGGHSDDWQRWLADHPDL